MKKGVSLLIVVVAISVMVVLISTTIIFGTSAINTAQYEEFLSQLNRVSSSLNEYTLENKSLPITNEVISGVSLGDKFFAELIKKGDENNRLYVIDVNLLRDATIKRGYGTIKNQDIFVVAENTNNIYYVKGFKYKGKVYFGQKVD